MPKKENPLGALVVELLRKNKVFLSFDQICVGLPGFPRQDLSYILKALKEKGLLVGIAPESHNKSKYYGLKEWVENGEVIPEHGPKLEWDLWNFKVEPILYTSEIDMLEQEILSILDGVGAERLALIKEAFAKYK